MKQSLICHSAFISHPYILCKSKIFLGVEKIYFCISCFYVSISSKKYRKRL